MPAGVKSRSIGTTSPSRVVVTVSVGGPSSAWPAAGALGSSDSRSRPWHVRRGGLTELDGEARRGAQHPAVGRPRARRRRRHAGRTAASRRPAWRRPALAAALRRRPCAPASGAGGRAGVVSAGTRVVTQRATWAGVASLGSRSASSWTAASAGTLDGASTATGVRREPACARRRRQTSTASKAGGASPSTTASGACMTSADSAALASVTASTP